jgi:energy-coupling factor transporter ATP-binding protein EcfA2
MLKLIVGKKGSGKTKQLISMVNESVTKTKGKVACIEKGTKLTFDVNHGVRLLNTDTYCISGYDAFYGFLAGIAASDYDVKEIYVDSVGKIAGSDPAALEKLFDEVDALSEKEDVAFIMTLSLDASELAEKSKKYVI